MKKNKKLQVKILLLICGSLMVIVFLLLNSQSFPFLENVQPTEEILLPSIGPPNWLGHIYPAPRDHISMKDYDNTIRFDYYPSITGVNLIGSERENVTPRIKVCINDIQLPRDEMEVAQYVSNNLFPDLGIGWRNVPISNPGTYIVRIDILTDEKPVFSYEWYFVIEE